MLDRLVSASVALSLALLVWLYARSRDQETLEHVPVPVQVVLGSQQAGQYELEVAGPQQVLATFSGPPSRIRELRAMVQRDELRVELPFTVPAERLRDSRVSEVLTVDPDSVQAQAPSGVTVSMVPGRNQVRLVLHRLIERRLPVRFDHSFETHLGPMAIDPPTVLVRGPQELLEKMTAIPTQACVLPHRPASAPAARVALIHEIENRAVTCTPPYVRVRSNPLPVKSYELADVPVHFLCPANFAFRPRFPGAGGKVTLRLSGPARDEYPRVYAFVDLTRVPATAGTHVEPVQIQYPRGFHLDEGPRVRDVQFELVPTRGR